jgi:hypothetical protein
LDEILKSEENPKIPTKDPRWRELTTQFRGLFTPSDIDDMREVLPEHLQQTHFQELIGHMKENVIGTSALHSIAEAVALVNFITSRLLANYVLTVQDALVIKFAYFCIVVVVNLNALMSEFCHIAAPVEMLWRLSRSKLQSVWTRS